MSHQLSFTTPLDKFQELAPPLSTVTLNCNRGAIQVIQ